MRNWTPPWSCVTHHYGDVPEVGMVIGLEHAAWEITHISEHPNDEGQIRATFHRLHGPKHQHENSRGDAVMRIPARGVNFDEYKSGRVWLCSCCGHPVPCRMEVAEKESAKAAGDFEERLKRMGPGLCYGCGEVITSRQGRVTFPGDHADFPGRGGPTFHTRKSCYGERRAYAKRAGVTPEATPPALIEELT